MTIVRFAPSPTGYLHIGGVRTALFNYFFARSQNGSYVLRIEDTDVSRSSSQMAEVILDGLRWLGIHWDQGPFYQSQRFDLYKAAAYRLLEEKKAYRCFCSQEELAQSRNPGADANEDKVYKYHRHCAHLTSEQIAEKLSAKAPYVIRFFIPPGKTYFKDTIHKEMAIDNGQLDDFVLLKTDHSPTYHLAVVVDDSDMAISNVIRGDDHISNTFKQVLLFQAMGLKPPRYAHLPLILGADKKKLSKRHGETSVLEFKKQGYLPEAIINYLSQLSWIPADSKKIFTMQELIDQFNIGKLSKNSPVFDYDKLRYLNSRVIQEKESKEILTLLEEDSDFKETHEHVSESRKIALISLIKPRMKTLPEIVEKFAIYLAEVPFYNPKAIPGILQNHSAADVCNRLQALADGLEKLVSTEFSGAVVENVLRDCAARSGLSAADFIHPARFALTTETVSPSLFDVFEFFGKEESVNRLHYFISFLEKTVG